MTIAEYHTLLGHARSVLERYMFDGDMVRDDIAEICARIDAAVIPTAQSNPPKVLQGIERAA